MLDIDKLYYIMDYSGNYFRINERNDLVIAKSVNDAAVFSFIEANKRINTGHKNKFYFMTPVEETNDTYQKNGEEVIPMSGNLANVIISIANEVKKSAGIEDNKSLLLEYDLSKIDWQEYLLHFTYVTEALAGYRDSLVKAESDVDLKICDILHYIELYDTNLEEATSLVELLKECREHRRNVKDEIFRLDTFQRTVGTNANLIKAKEAIKCIKGLENRKYTPRKLSDLFDGKSIMMRSKNEKIINEHVSVNGVIVDKDEERREFDNMNMVRRETVFDGKGNDWMAFAIQQAEFYRNAKQYIVNIKLDICDIDEEIANLMDEIDTANCNVAQGYKMFKRLKELRMKRKEKEQELQCLYTLTDRFDMDVMADECESSAYEIERILSPDESFEESNVNEKVEEVCAAV